MIRLACSLALSALLPTLVRPGSSPGERAAGEAVPFSSDAWEIAAQESRIEEVDGVETLVLLNGSAVLPSAELIDGVLEVDLRVTPERGFCGLLWRIGELDYEHFYVRPHLSGLPDASQYQPVIHGVEGWQIYSGPAYTAPVELAFDRWMHLRVEVLGDRAQVFVDGGEPVLVIDDLGNQAAAGAVGLSASFAEARFANFRFTPTSELSIRPAAHAPAHVAPMRSGGASEGLVRTWSISDAFDEALLADGASLEDALPAGLAFHMLEVEPNGIANLARIQGSRPASTALARLVLEAEEPTRQRIDFGFSDRVRVYQDGELLFVGDDGYATRDYRFLGTVGLNDSLVLDLHAGRSVLDLAVSESFGGWGVCARLEPGSGVRLVEPLVEAR